MDSSNADLRANWRLLICYLLVFLALAWAGYRFWNSFGYVAGVMNDEAEKFVAALMIENGARLYGDVFAHHGPLAYLVSHLTLLITDSVDFRTYRVVIALFYLLVTLAVYKSPIFETKPQRALSAAVFMGITGTYSASWSGHMMLYQNLAGGFFLVFLAQLLMPAMFGKPTSRSGTFLAGFAFVLVFFAAYSYTVSLFLSVATLYLIYYFKRTTFRLEQIKTFLFGIGLGLIVFIAWFAWAGDPLGYLVYHFYFNQQIYSTFISFNFFSTLKTFASFLANPLGALSFPQQVYSLFSGLLVVSMAGFLVKRMFLQRMSTTGFLPLLTLSFAFLYLNPTGGLTSGHGMASYCTVSAGFFAMVIGSCHCPRINLKYSISFFVLAFSLVLSPLVSSADAAYGYISVAHLQKAQHNKMNDRRYRALIDWLQSQVPPEEPIGVYTFSPQLYLDAQRLPASGHFFYLPWQAEYAKSPLWGVNIDLCADLQQKQPRVMIVDNRKIWDAYQMNDYAPCVESLLKDKYIHVANGIYFLKSKSSHAVPDNSP